MRRRTLLTAGLVALTLLAAGCGGAEEEAATLTPQERLAAAQAAIENAGALTIDLTSTGVPEDVNGVQSAKGTGVIEGELIKFTGEFQGRISGFTATAGILVIGDDAYMKLFTPDFEPVDLDTLNVESPAAFFAPDSGISALMAATTDLAAGGQVRQGSEILTEITGKLPGEKIEALLRLGGAGRTFDVTYGLTDGNELRKAVLTGEFWEGTEATYTLVITDYGKVVPIEAPAG